MQKAMARPTLVKGSGALVFTIDRSSDFGQRVLRHLEEEIVVWLTTTRPGVAPQPSPVWFLWHDNGALMFSQPNTPKLRNIEANPRVALNFNCTPEGGDVVVMSASAEVLSDLPPADVLDVYLAKYGRNIEQLGSTPDGFLQSYSVPVRITPTSLRGH
jgi:PPOX class probable F420-dependent enzyme